MRHDATATLTRTFRSATAASLTALIALLLVASPPPPPARADAPPNAQPAAISGDITLESTSSAGVKGNEDSFVPSISSSGRTVAFTSHATNLGPGDTDNTPDVYVKDTTTGALALASTTGTGTKGNGFSFEAAISGDGGSVAFGSQATNLDPGDTDPGEDVYVKDLGTGSLTIASTSDAGTKGNGTSEEPSLSRTGQRVAFASGSTNLDPADTDPANDVYLKKLATGDLVLVSTSSTGVKGNGNSGDASISKTGTRVAFGSSSSNLDPGDGDFTGDVFVKDVSTGTTFLASTSSAGVKATGTASSRRSPAGAGTSPSSPRPTTWTRRTRTPRSTCT